MTFITLTNTSNNDTDQWTFDPDFFKSNRLRTNLLSLNESNVYYAFNSEGGVDITQTPTIIDFDDIHINTTNYNNYQGTITISEEGIYFVSFTLVTGSSDMRGDTRGSLHSYIDVDEGDGYSVYPGSRVSNYMREQNSGITDYLVTKTIPIQINRPNTKIRVMCLNNSTTTTSTTQKEECTLFINKL